MDFLPEYTDIVLPFPSPDLWTPESGISLASPADPKYRWYLRWGGKKVHDLETTEHHSMSGEEHCRKVIAFLADNENRVHKKKLTISGQSWWFVDGGGVRMSVSTTTAPFNAWHLIGLIEGYLYRREDPA